MHKLFDFKTLVKKKGRSPGLRLVVSLLIPKIGTMTFVVTTS